MTDKAPPDRRSNSEAEKARLEEDAELNAIADERADGPFVIVDLKDL